jgi:hypothetical protein
MYMKILGSRLLIEIQTRGVFVTIPIFLGEAFVDIPAGDMAPAEVAPPPAIALSGFPRSPPSHSLAQNYLRPRARAAN